MNENSIRDYNECQILLNHYLNDYFKTTNINLGIRSQEEMDTFIENNKELSLDDLRERYNVFNKYKNRIEQIPEYSFVVQGDLDFKKQLDELQEIANNAAIFYDVEIRRREDRINELRSVINDNHLEFNSRNADKLIMRKQSEINNLLNRYDNASDDEKDIIKLQIKNKENERDSLTTYLSSSSNQLGILQNEIEGLLHGSEFVNRKIKEEQKYFDELVNEYNITDVETVSDKKEIDEEQKTESIHFAKKLNVNNNKNINNDDVFDLSKIIEYTKGMTYNDLIIEIIKRTDMEHIIIKNNINELFPNILLNDNVSFEDAQKIVKLYNLNLKNNTVNKKNEKNISNNSNSKDIENNNDSDKNKKPTDLPSHLEISDPNAIKEEKLNESQNNIIEENMPKSRTRGIKEILDYLSGDLEFTHKDEKKYVASNIQVTGFFKSRAHKESRIYSAIGFIPSLLKEIQGLFKRGKKRRSQKYMDKIKDKTDTLNQRLSSLSEEEFQILVDEYQGNLMIERQDSEILNGSIMKEYRRRVDKRRQEYNEQKNEQVVKLFDIKSSLNSIDEELKSNKTTDEKRQQLLEAKNKLLSEVIPTLEKMDMDRKKINKELGSGLHGFEESMRAFSSRMNVEGGLFSKKNDQSKELSNQEAQLEKTKFDSIEKGDALSALDAFIKEQVLLAENTDIKKNIWGSVSEGKRRYDPYSHELDYRSDTLIQDIMTLVKTGALVAGGIALVNNIIERVNLINEANAKIDTANINGQNVVNSANSKITEARNIGKKIESQRETVNSGFKAQGNTSIGADAGLREKGALERANYITGRSGNVDYTIDDNAQHLIFNGDYESFAQSIGKVTQGIKNGTISAQNATEEFAKVANEAAKNCVEACKQYLPSGKVYAANASYDTTGFMETATYLVNNSDAISRMNDAVCELLNHGTRLQGLSDVEFKMVENISANGFTAADAIIGSAMIAGLAGNMSKSLQTFGELGKYGTIQQKVDEYRKGLK